VVEARPQQGQSVPEVSIFLLCFDVVGWVKPGVIHRQRLFSRTTGGLKYMGTPAELGCENGGSGPFQSYCK